MTLSAPVEHTDATVDAKGKMCPVPIVMLAKAAKELRVGQVVMLLATDRGAKPDVAAWAERTGNEVLGMTEDNGVMAFYVRKTD